MLDSFGRSPETFIARHATTTDIILFGLVVAFVPGLVVAAIGSATAVFGETVRTRAHLVLVTLLGGLAAWRMGRDITSWPGDATKLILVALLVGPLLGVLRWRVPATATFLRWAGAASVIFLLQFLVMSPSTDVAFGSPPGVDEAVDRQVAADLGDDPASVVLVVLDALPTTSLLDGRGQVDADVFPNIAELAATSTWYRNNTTVAGFTGEAIPALFTGRYPEPDGPAPDLEEKNLFTLLGGSYDMHVNEQVTQLCPADLCPAGASAGLGTLIDDAVTWWQGKDSTAAEDDFDLPAVLHEARYDAARDWIADLDISDGGRADLTMLHVVLPHGPYQFTDTGAVYGARDGMPFGSEYGVWTETGDDVGLQRHILQTQAADRLVGQLMDQLRDAGTYDDSLVILTADHGESFLPGTPTRWLAPENAPHIVWTPLFVKEPGQVDPAVDDHNVLSIDVVPTIADHLGVDIPWDVDGAPVGQDPPARGDGDPKLFTDFEKHAIHPEEGESYIEIDGGDYFDDVLAADQVTGTGTNAVWKRTDHGELFGRPVDDLRVGDRADPELLVEERDRFDDIDTGEPLPIELIGHIDLPVGTPVAFALDGTIGVLTTVEGWPDGGLVHGLMPPDLFDDGANELTAYVIEGPPGDEVLRPLDLVD